MQRRDLLKLGAAGSLAAGVATLTQTGAAAAAPKTVGGVHLHATLKETTDSTFGGSLDRIISIDVFGADDDLSGSGWDADVGADVTHPEQGDVSQCYFTQRGTLQGDTLTLVGRTLFATLPPDIGAKVTTTANLAAGEVRWVFERPAGPPFIFEGKGTVARI
jgi:hypothetical protein